jgi:hypothetical protein
MRATHTTSSFLNDHVKNKHPGIPLNEKDAGFLEDIDEDMGTLWTKISLVVMRGLGASSDECRWIIVDGTQ